MTQRYFTAWIIHTETAATAFRCALQHGQIKREHSVFRGPSGDVVVAENIGELGIEYADYIEDGTVVDYLIDEV